MHFNDEGDVIEMLAKLHGNIEDGVVVQRPWRGLFSQHRELGGRRIPTVAEVGYIYDNGYRAYWRGEIIEYSLQ